MSVSITGKLNKAANEFSAGESIGFGLRLGQQYYDRETKQKEWTNYSCVVFAKAGPQADFYHSSLVEGSIVAIRGGVQKIDSFEGNNGTVLSIEILNATIENVYTMGQSAAPAQQPQPQPQPQGFNQAPAPKPQPKSFGDFNTPAPATDPWLNYIPNPNNEKVATIEQIKAGYKGDLNAAIEKGHVVKAQQAPNFDDFDSDIPF